MKNSLIFIFIFLTQFLIAQKANKQTIREEWLTMLDKIARPVLSNLANNQLKENMQVILSPKVDNKIERAQDAYLEAFARTLAGIAPWLQLDSVTNKELVLQTTYRKMALLSLTNATNPNAKDYLKWTSGGQHLVDASFLALALIRCPWLWQNADTATKKKYTRVLFTNTKYNTCIY